MAPNSDNTPRDGDRPEENPFIAFRRFTDSHVSSLLNSVFTLPATLAKLTNAHQAREQCLFGRANQQQCEQLKGLEDKVAKVRAECRDNYIIGDMHSARSKAEELMELDREADVLRKQIVDATNSSHRALEDSRKHSEIVEKVANEKSREWGWDCSWGWFHPFDGEEQVGRSARKEHCQQWHRHHEIDARFEQKWEDIKRRMMEEQPRNADTDINPTVWSWSWSWPLSPNDSKSGKPPDVQSENVIDELGNLIVDEFNRALLLMRPRGARDLVSYEPRMLEQDQTLGRLGIHWRDAFEDLWLAEHGMTLIPEGERGRSRNMAYDQWVRRFHAQPFKPLTSSYKSSQPVDAAYPKHVPWASDEEEEPSYEYGHDHEDQHDEPPTPRVKQGRWETGMPETELDAYERLLSPAPPSGNGSERPSVLSTLTTTERTVGPDGTVTTKVVLKKRFADGREESSETVHSQRGQENDERSQDSFKALREAQFPLSKKERDEQTPAKKTGWFWSR